MTQLYIQREVLSFDEKTALAELEKSKADERVKELRYQKARFLLDTFMMQAKEQQQQQPEAPAQPES